MKVQLIVLAVVATIAVCGSWYLLTHYSLVENTGSQAPEGQASTSPAVVPTPVTPTSAPTSTASATSATHAPVKTTPKTVSVPATVKGVGPLALILGYKKPLVCSVKTRSGTIRSGTLYVAGEKARFTFTASSMIDDGVNLYVWKQGATTGVKLAASMSVNGSIAASHGGVDPATDLSFSCAAWATNSSVFVPPSTVTF